jgi:hypothetical protein
VSLDDATARLLEAWRGEIEAGAVYELIARRENSRRAEILPLVRHVAATRTAVERVVIEQ